MTAPTSLDDRVSESVGRMSPAEQRVARFFTGNREEILIASASALAAMAGTSDATVIRTARTLGFTGMDELRRSLVAELRQNPSPAARVAETLKAVGKDPASALSVTLDIHRDAIERLRRDITPALFQDAVERIAGAGRIFIFGIGPSSAMAEYFAIQLGRFGLDARSLTQTGLLLADGLQQLRSDDLVLIFAYGRVYREVAALVKQARRCGAATMLFTDSLGPKLRRSVDMVLPVERGRADMVSMHTATLALIEALLVGVAAHRPDETMASLKSLNSLRADLAGEPMDLPAQDASRNRRR